MNGSISGLGEFLAGAYHDKINQWSAVGFAFTADDLSASSGLAEDVLRLEEEWRAFAALDQTFRTDFIPQDLFEASTANQLQEPSPPLHAVKKGGKDPFLQTAQSGFTSVPAGSLPGAELLPTEHKEVRNTNLPAPDSTADLPGNKSSSLPHPKSKDLSFEYPENPTSFLKGNNLAASIHLEIPPEEVISPLQSQGLASQDKLEGTMAQEGYGQPDTSSGDSIWFQPLHGLGDFATRITYPVTETEKSSQIKLPTPHQVTLTQTTGPAERDNPAGDEFLKWPARMRLPGTPAGGSETVPLPGRKEERAAAAQTADSLPEAQPFEQDKKQSIPDTDDILEALTDRILRDFYRYYP